MPGLNEENRELRALIGAAGFVRRDRLRRALFLSDYPALRAGEAPAVTARLEEAGWLVDCRGGLAFLDWPWARYAAFFEQLGKNQGEDEPGLCPLLRLHEAPVAEGMPGDARQALLMWAADERGPLKRRAEEALGAALRRKEKVPGFYRALLKAAAGREGEPC